MPLKIGKIIMFKELEPGTFWAFSFKKNSHLFVSLRSKIPPSKKEMIRIVADLFPVGPLMGLLFQF